MAGLNICTRWRAIPARRSRRMSSSLLPENIGPTTTSIQPMLPFTMSTRYLLTQHLAGEKRISRFGPCKVRTTSLLRYFPSLSAGGAVWFRHLRVVKRRESRKHRQAKCLLPGDHVGRQDAPSALRIANSDFACETIDGSGKFNAFFHDFIDQGFGEFDAAGTSEKTFRAIGYVGPAFEENPVRAVFECDVQTTFEANVIGGAAAVLLESLLQRLSSLTRATHKFFARARCVADAAFRFEALHFDIRFGVELAAKRRDSFFDRAKFRTAGTADGNQDSGHGWSSSADGF